MTKIQDLSKGEIIIYESEGKSNLEVIQQDNTLWLSAEKIGKLFGKDRSIISKDSLLKYIKNKSWKKIQPVHFLHKFKKKAKQIVLSVLNRGGVNVYNRRFN